MVNLVLDKEGGNLSCWHAVDERIFDETRCRFHGDLRGRRPNCVGPNDFTTPPDRKDLPAEGDGIIFAANSKALLKFARIFPESNEPTTSAAAIFTTIT